MAVRLLDPFPQRAFTDLDGVPLALGKINTYDADGVTPKVTYTATTAAMGEEHANPIILDATGRPPAPIFWTVGESYNVVVTDADDVTVGPDVLSFEVPADPTSNSFYEIVLSFVGNPDIAAMFLGGECLARSVVSAANFAGSFGLTPETLPAADYVVSVQINGVEIGTATCDKDDGAWTFATTGGAVKSGIAGDEIKFFGPDPADASMADFGITLAWNLA